MGAYFDVLQMAILNIMSLIIDKLSDDIEESTASSLIQYLPLLWEESKDHDMLRCAILSTLVRNDKDEPLNELAQFVFYFSTFRSIKWSWHTARFPRKWPHFCIRSLRLAPTEKNHRTFTCWKRVWNYGWSCSKIVHHSMLSYSNCQIVYCQLLVRFFLI